MKIPKCVYFLTFLVTLFTMDLYQSLFAATENSLDRNEQIEYTTQSKPEASQGDETGDTTSNGKNSEKKAKVYKWFPVIFYTQETSLALGAGSMQVFRWDKTKQEGRANSITALGFYTLKDQVSVEIAPDLYFRNELYNVKFRVNFSSLPSTFFGTGENLDEDAEGEDYESKNVVFQSDFIRKIIKSFRAGFRYEWHDYDVRDKEPGGLLDQGLFVGSDGGLISGVGIILDQDNRDSPFWSSRGGYHQLVAMKYSDKLGSDFNFNQYIIDLRQFVSLNRKSVLAFQEFLQFSEGEVPFNRLPQLGGPTIMRGIYQGRFRDNDLIAVQSEYRWQFKPRWSMAAFASVGDVAHQLNDFEFNDLKYTVGGGFRFALDPKNKLNLRMDIGISKFGIAPTIILGEAF